jgi:glycosyltransferase involved in cell wall biosynthesis
VKVVLATGIYPPDIGGPATYVSHLAPALVARGHAVEVVTYATGMPRPSEGEDGRVRRVRRDRPLPLRYAAYFAAVRETGRSADVVYLQDPLSAGGPGLVAARALGVPTLLKVAADLAWEISSAAGWVEDPVDAFQSRRYAPWVEAVRRAEHAVARGARHVVVPAAHLARMVEGWGVAPERLSVIENAAAPVHGAASREEARRALGLPAGTVVASAGRLLPYKGFDLLIAAAAEVRRDLAPLTVVIAGEGPEQVTLAAQIRAAALTDVVRLAGNLSAEEMSLLRRASDVFALLSTHEGRSHVLLEAMRDGLPIVASDVTGNRELLQGHAPALLVPRTVAGVAHALRAQAGAPAPAPVREDTGWPVMVSRTLELLERTAREG